MSAPDWNLKSPGLPGLPERLLLLSALLIIGASGNLLALWGYNYAGEGGNPLEKIHPSTLTLLLAWLSFLAYREGGARLMALLRQPGILIGLCCSVLAIVYAQLVLGQPLSGVVVSWLSPVLLLALLLQLNESQKRRLEYLLYALMLVNTVMGVIEFAQGSALVPPVLLDYTGFGQELDMAEWGEWRASGLFGHPLAATLGCGIFVVTLYTRLCFRRLSLVQGFTLLHCLAVMPLFGGRTSIFATLLFVLLLSSGRVLLEVWGRPRNRIDPLKVMLSLLLLLLLALYAYQAGMFDPLLERMQDDNGSGRTRLAAWEIFLNTPLSEILLGDFRGMLVQRQVIFGTVYGIEVFWLGMLLIYGLVGSALLFASGWRVLRAMAVRVSPLTWWPAAFFLFAISSGVGLTVKSTSFSTLLLVMLLLRDAPLPRRGR
ncbi:VpsF family polysaccharide biosynthesis protein [Uliginosibacterium sp. 31-12]|uniref:VpsF family polysaccharide biosynthesis protein n=1 Tax=Uliginosibacterium sp. 31-12 TaxID=3062781 RepID=UPI0026E440CD|nr:VpsF family polysaccharide biosynthesis protein [Uliginosibacterium sp. 31-12]MDO6386054.1 VpsF family polysaccharide biosynthesis protein [Uliginosibacterium sp. 31-12]